MTEPSIDEMDRIALRRFRALYWGCYLALVALLAVQTVFAWRWTHETGSVLIAAVVLLAAGAIGMAQGMAFLERLHIRVDAKKRKP